MLIPIPMPIEPPIEIPIEMPKLSDTMTEGTLVKWHKTVGEPVAAGDVLAEIETDKAIMEMEAFDDGTLTEICLQEGHRGAVGQKIGVLALAGKSLQNRPAMEKTERVLARESTPQTTAAAVKTEQEAPRIKASPIARKEAAQHGVDLARITGTGPSGRIMEKDVQAAVATKPPLAAGPESGCPAPVPLSGMRRTIAERLVASKTTIPHFYLQIEADAGPLRQLRLELNARWSSAAADSPASSPPPDKITFNDLILKATSLALCRVPGVNASWVEPGTQAPVSEPAIVHHPGIHLAVAVALEGGLVTPVLRNADRLSLGELSAAVRALASRARARQLRPEETQGGTFTVSNLGAHGIASFYAIINPPQAAILSVGAVVRQPVVNAAGEVVAGWRMALGLSADHRVVDGALGAQFLGEVRRLLENPAQMPL